jgi:hypothetical protein
MVTSIFERFAKEEHADWQGSGVDPNQGVAKGSSGYITCSGNTSHSSKTRLLRTFPGGNSDQWGDLGEGKKSW